MESSAPNKIEVQSSRMVAFGLSDTGLVRQRNEDAIAVDANAGVALLADGMGGHERGAEASRLALESIIPILQPENLKNELLNITDGGGSKAEIAGYTALVERAVYSANRRIFKRNLTLNLRRFMGTTVVGVVFIEGARSLWFHVGDSRIYRWRRERGLECMTKDHSAFCEWEDAGRVGFAPPKNIITRALGPAPEVRATVGSADLDPEDIYLLCSDGLTDMLTDDELTDILDATPTLDTTIQNLVEAANRAGGRDNISVILCRMP